MKKAYTQLIKAIEVTKKYTSDEVKQLSWLFMYLNNINIDEEEFKTWISAKGLWKLLKPLTKTGNTQQFNDWWESVSNIARLKENIDYERIEEIEIQAKSTTLEFSKVEKRPVKKVDYILTLRAWEYCAVLTKWDSWDLYRRFIFDIKDEFIRLVFRFWKSIESRNDFTNSIWNLDFMKELKEINPKDYSNIYWEMTNVVYLELYGVKAFEFKEKNKIPVKDIAKHYFDKNWLFDLEKVENKLAWIIEFNNPKNKEDLKKLIQNFIKKTILKWE